MYELSQSLGITGRPYTYDMYTAVPEHTYENCKIEEVSRVVVGITDCITITTLDDQSDPDEEWLH